MIEQLKYVGWREDLRGRIALARSCARAGRVLVQFNFTPGTKFDVHGAPIGHDSLCYGWHDFAADQFVEASDEEIYAATQTSED